MRRDFFSFPSILNDSFERQVNGGGMARVYILPKIVMFFRGFLKESTRMMIFIPENKEKGYCISANIIVFLRLKMRQVLKGGNYFFFRFLPLEPCLYYIFKLFSFLYPTHPPYQHKYNTERQQN